MMAVATTTPQEMKVAKRRAKQYICLLFLLFANQAEAQSNQFVWMRTSLRYKPIKPITLEATQHFRFAVTPNQIDSLNPELTLKYAPLKWFNLGIGYRYIYERTKNDDLEPAHRYHIQTAVDRNFGPTELSYRLRYQEKHEEDEYHYSSSIRSKLSIELDTDKDYTPFLLTEFFNDPRNEFYRSKYRIGVGSKIKIDKRHRLSVRYLYQKNADDGAIPEHILDLEYQYRLKKKKKKNK